MKLYWAHLQFQATKPIPVRSPWLPTLIRVYVGTSVGVPIDAIGRRYREFAFRPRSCPALSAPVTFDSRQPETATKTGTL